MEEEHENQSEAQARYNILDLLLDSNLLFKYKVLLALTRSGSGGV